MSSVHFDSLLIKKTKQNKKKTKPKLSVCIQGLKIRIERCIFLTMAASELIPGERHT